MPTGDVLHHPHHSMAVSIMGHEGDDFDANGSPDEDGRGRRRPTRGQSRIEFERLAAFFHVPINEAAKGLGVCATVLKKVCRKHGIPRWPHRKIKKLDTMLAMLETASNKPGNPQHDDDVRKKMDAVIRDRMVLMTEGKLVGEGKSERRSKSEGKKDRKRKKPSDDEDEEEEPSEHDSLDSSQDHMVAYSPGACETHDILHDPSPPVILASQHNPHINLSAMDLNGFNGYLFNYNAMNGYPTPQGYNTVVVGNGMGGYHTTFNTIFYGGNPAMMSANNVSLPGVQSISSGVIGGTAPMMMHNIPYHSSNPLSSSLPSIPTPSNLSIPLATSVPTNLNFPHHPHYAKHMKLSYDTHLSYSNPPEYILSPPSPSDIRLLGVDMALQHQVE